MVKAYRNVERLKEILINNRRFTIKEVADNVGLSIGSFHDIFSNVLELKNVAAKFTKSSQ